MKRQSTLFTEVLAYISIYPLLLTLLVLSGLGCALLFYMVPASEDSPGAIHIRSLAALPTPNPIEPATEVAAGAAPPAEAALKPC